MTSHGSPILFNINDGFFEAIVRGFRSGILTSIDYTNLTQCESLEDIKLPLSSTDYGDFLANESSPIHTTTILNKCIEKLVSEFNYIKNQCVEPLKTFLDYICYGYMIDNIVLLITGTLNERNLDELLEKCHPLGKFESMGSLTAINTITDLYNQVLIDTPLAPYFKDITEGDLNELNIEIIRNTLYKLYLEDFYGFCKKLGKQTSVIMGDILRFEADRRSINITINSFGTELTKDDRKKLYPAIGILYPEGIIELSKADDIDQVKVIAGCYPEYKQIFNEAEINAEKSLEDLFFEREVYLNKMAFETQFGYGIFYSYVKLREQEIRNIIWIAECISQGVKEKINQFIDIFEK